MLGCVGVSFQRWGRTTKAAAAAALYYQLIIVIYFAARQIFEIVGEAVTGLWALWIFTREISILAKENCLNLKYPPGGKFTVRPTSCKNR